MAINRWYIGIIVLCIIGISAKTELVQKKRRNGKKKSVLTQELLNMRKELAYAYNEEIVLLAQTQNNMSCKEKDNNQKIVALAHEQNTNIYELECVLAGDNVYSRDELQKEIDRVQAKVCESREHSRQMQINKQNEQKQRNNNGRI